ncbi:hypothetical protein PNEG_02462 [Pneumocystis murina B123]|uniref:Uncharacterized protein n=1 Tax=Pneumocystis murina (strain B123) TaxID=1069680 RepID=M7PF79_PNEMU|nr:hypothetical protein PNEG_02462 [Pneumocystis murina B123]EMR09119.1 hypothetical protein PNEG_02462 [Pneumocystis murina B123]
MDKMNRLNMNFRNNSLLTLIKPFEASRVIVSCISQSFKQVNLRFTHQNTYSWPNTLSRKRKIVYVISGITIWAFVLGVSFNYQRYCSPVISYLMYELKRSPTVETYLGKNIDFSSKWPWIYGKINNVKGHINISFRVSGSKDSAIVKFKSVRKEKGVDWVTLEWTISPSKNHEEISLLDELNLLSK